MISYPHVSFVRSRFEELKGGQNKFDLVISAQAYHWVPEEVRYERTASFLKDRGHLAAFWNMYPGMDEKIRVELDHVYQKRAPELVKSESPVNELIKNRADSLRGSPYFDKVVVSEYPWSTRYKTNEYLGLLNTYSDHLRLPKQRRIKLFRDIAEVIDQNGGIIEKPYLAVLDIAQKNSAYGK